MAECGNFQALAENALRLLDDEALARRLAMNGRRDVETRYTWPAVHAAWRRVYGISELRSTRSAVA
jgi:glycosyltransferase involved in cell wall biosynthesis